MVRRVWLKKSDKKKKRTSLKLASIVKKVLIVIMDQRENQ